MWGTLFVLKSFTTQDGEHNVNPFDPFRKEERPGVKGVNVTFLSITQTPSRS